MEHHNDFVRIEIMEAELEIEENISNRESVWMDSSVPSLLLCLIYL